MWKGRIALDDDDITDMIIPLGESELGVAVKPPYQVMFRPYISRDRSSLMSTIDREAPHVAQRGWPINGSEQPRGISPGAIGAPSLVPSSQCIIPKYVRFHLQLFEPVLENIANADDPHELIAVLDRHMANAPPRHELHHIGNAVLR
jgi:hypothetical protein